MRLTQDFFQASTLTLAKCLLGQRLVRQMPGGIVAGWIVEVEAYLWRGDPACHAARGMKPGNAAMFGPAGTLYVYPIHAKFCMNIVSESQGRGAAVLIRAIQPTHGLPLMRANRPSVSDIELTNGPGKLCAAMDIDCRQNGIDLTTYPDVWIESMAWPKSTFKMQRTGRIGISAGQDKPWRFFIDGNRFVSGRASDHTQPRFSL